MVFTENNYIYVVVGVSENRVSSGYPYITMSLWLRYPDKQKIAWSYETRTFIYQTNVFLIPERYAEAYKEELQSHIKAAGWKQLISVGFMPTLGYDPEVFLENGTGEVIPAFMFLPKKTSETLTFWDGFQAEFIPDENLVCLANSTDAANKGLQQILALARLFDKTARFSQKSVVAISSAALANASDEHVNFNCNPSLNVYETFVPVLDDPRALNIRFAGGHLHFGHQRLQQSDTIKKVVKLLDAISGVMSVSIAEGLDTALRRQYYGRAGEYRLTPWGFEYRVLSNYWLLHPQLMHLTFDIARMVISFSLNDGGLVWDATEEETRNTINKNDVKYARKLLTRNKEIVNELITLRYRPETVTNEARKAIQEIIFSGAHKCLPLESIEMNWHLSETWKAHSALPNCCWEVYQ